MGMHTPDRGTKTVLSEINVTPFVDVMLVLLVIFMVVAPKLQQGMDVALPEVEATPMVVEQDKEIVLTINKEGKILVDDKEISRDKLKAELKALAAKLDKQEVFLKADKDVKYGVVAAVLAEARAAGIKGIGMITEVPPAGKTEDKGKIK